MTVYIQITNYIAASFQCLFDCDHFLKFTCMQVYKCTWQDYYSSLQWSI